MQNPGWSAQRHRRGRRFYESRQIQPQAPASRLSPSNAASKRRAADATPGDGRNLDKLGFASAGSGTPSYPASECPAIPSLARSGGSSRTPLECGCSTDRLVATQFSARKTAPSLPLLRPTVIDRAPWEIIPDKLIVYRLDFLLRRGARCRSAREPGLPVANFFDCAPARGRLLIRSREPRQKPQRGLAVSWQIDAASESKAGSHVLPSGEEKTVGKLRFAGASGREKSSLSERGRASGSKPQLMKIKACPAPRPESPHSTPAPALR